MDQSPAPQAEVRSGYFSPWNYVIMHVFVFSAVFLLTNVLLSIIEFPPSRIAPFLEEHAEDSYDLVIVGNSMANENVNIPQISEKMGMNVFQGAKNGTSSAWWYLAIKNLYLKLNHKPSTVVLFFRNRDLTEPLNNVIGKNEEFQTEISLADEPVMRKILYEPSFGPIGTFAYEHVPLYRGKQYLRHLLVRMIAGGMSVFVGKPPASVEDDFLDFFAITKLDPELRAKATASMDAAPLNGQLTFAEALPTSFLPEIVKETKDANVRLILVRVKVRKYTQNAESKREKKYMDDLRAYLQKEDITLIDYTERTEISADLYKDGDHLNKKTGVPLFTDMLAEDLLQALRDR